MFNSCVRQGSPGHSYFISKHEWCILRWSHTAMKAFMDGMLTDYSHDVASTSLNNLGNFDSP
jgi:hypothetical protein